MKNCLFFLLVALMLGSQSNLFAGSYQRWIVWVNEPRHISNPSEMADIFAGLSQGKILPNKLYQVGQTTFKITYPESYFVYLKKCIQVSDPSITTVAEMIKAIKNGEKVQWGNDLHMKTKNYWINSSGEVVFTENYSGAELGVWVLLINGIPTIKLDCGNPLEVYLESQQQQNVVKIDGSSKDVVPDDRGKNTNITQQPCGTTIINHYYYDSPQESAQQQDTRTSSYSEYYVPVVYTSYYGYYGGYYPSRYYGSYSSYHSHNSHDCGGTYYAPKL